MRQVIRLRKKDAAERQEEEALLDLYMHALGMAPANSGQAAEARRMCRRQAGLPSALIDQA